MKNPSPLLPPLSGIKFRLSPFLFTIFLVISGINTGTAQDQAIRKAVHKVIERYQESPSLKLDFEFQIVYPEQEPEILNGKFYKKGDLYKVDLGEYIIMSDAKAQYTLRTSEKEAQITSVDEETTELSSPSGILKYLAENDFKYFDKSDLNQGSQNLKIAEMIPEDKQSEYFKIRFSYNPSDELLKYIEIFSRDGTRIQLTIGDTSFADNFTKESISWSPEEYKDYYIEDLRID